MKLFNGILPCLLLPALPAWWEHQEKEEDDNEDDEDGEDEEEDDEDDDDKREKKEDEERDDALLTAHSGVRKDFAATMEKHLCLLRRSLIKILPPETLKPSFEPHLHLGPAILGREDPSKTKGSNFVREV